MRKLLLAFIVGLCPGIVFNVSKRNLLWIGFSGTLGWLVFSWVSNNAGGVIQATFWGAVAVGLYSEIMARIVKSPATVFSVSGIFPLVPGIPAYNTVQYLVENKVIDAAGKGLETIASAGAIAFGILLMSSLFRLPSIFDENYKRKKSH